MLQPLNGIGMCTEGFAYIFSVYGKRAGIHVFCIQINNNCFIGIQLILCSYIFADNGVCGYCIRLDCIRLDCINNAHRCIDMAADQRNSSYIVYVIPSSCNLIKILGLYGNPCGQDQRCGKSRTFVHEFHIYSSLFHLSDG